MIKTLKTAAITLFLASSVISNHARADEMDPHFVEFILQNESYVLSINEKAAEINETSAISCDSVEDRERLVPEIISPIEFQKIEKNKNYTQIERQKMSFPASGTWIEHIRQNGCPILKQLNVLAVALPGKVPELLSLNNGTTITDPFLQDKTEALVIETAKIAELECPGKKEVFIVDTAFEGFFDQAQQTLLRDNQNYGWQERWVTSMCEQRVDVKVEFLPNKDSGYEIETSLYDPSLASELSRRRQRNRQ